MKVELSLKYNFKLEFKVVEYGCAVSLMFPIKTPNFLCFVIPHYTSNLQSQFKTSITLCGTNRFRNSFLPNLIHE